MTEIKRVYWDACIFIKHISTKPGVPSVQDKLIIDGIDEVINEAENGRMIIVTSSLTRVEVLDCKIPPDGVTRYLKFLRREIVQEYDVDPRIGNAAHDIRAFYRKVGRSLSVPDAIHVATACLRGAIELHTLDGSGKSPKMTALSGRIADRWDLTICTPRPTTGRLFPFTQEAASEPKQIEATETTAGSDLDTPGIRRDTNGTPANAAGAEGESGQQPERKQSASASAPVTEGGEITPPAEPPTPEPTSES